MRFSFVVFFSVPPGSAIEAVSSSDVAKVRRTVASLPGLSRALLFMPEQAKDLFNDDGAPPRFGFQLYFSEYAALEAAAGPEGALRSLAASGALPSLDGLQVTQQAFLNRVFSVPEPKPALERACSYVVHYPGPAENENLWLRYYLAHHPPIMRRFPGIRELEILSRVDWVDDLPFWPRANHMQRNRIMFDSAADLTAALHSPVRHEMRADFAQFPPYRGGNLHFPMATEVIAPQG